MELRDKERAVVDALEDIKGHDIVVYNTAALPTMFERVVIASGDSTRQVKALADHVQEKLEALGARVYGVEGTRTAEWILVDLGDVVVHVFQEEARALYDIEGLWIDASRVPVPDADKVEGGGAKGPEGKAFG